MMSLPEWGDATHLWKYDSWAEYFPSMQETFKSRWGWTRSLLDWHSYWKTCGKTNECKVGEDLWRIWRKWSRRRNWGS